MTRLLLGRPSDLSGDRQIAERPGFGGGWGVRGQKSESDNAK